MITPELAAQRLSGVQSALDLSQSLATARGPTLPFSTFELRSLPLLGRLPASLLPRTRLPPGQPGPFDVCLLASIAGTEHPLGSEFDILLRGETSQPTEVRAVLVGVTLKSGHCCDSVPAGHETLCVVQFPSGIPPEILALPETPGSSEGPPVAWLGTRANLARTRTHEGPRPVR